MGELAITLLIIGVGLVFTSVYLIKRNRNKKEIDDMETEPVKEEPTKETAPPFKDVLKTLVEKDKEEQPEQEKVVNSPPSCLTCSTKMASAGSAFLPTILGKMVPLVQYVCPHCGTVCQYLRTPNVIKNSHHKASMFCFWTHPEARREFRARVDDTYMPFKDAQRGSA